MWVEQRRFALRHLKDFGFGKVGLQGVIQDEVEDLVKYFAKLANQDFRYTPLYIFSSSYQINQNGDCFWGTSYKYSLDSSCWKTISN